MKKCMSISSKALALVCLLSSFAANSMQMPQNVTVSIQVSNRTNKNLIVLQRNVKGETSKIGEVAANSKTRIDLVKFEPDPSIKNQVAANIVFQDQQTRRYVLGSELYLYKHQDHPTHASLITNLALAGNPFYSDSHSFHITNERTILLMAITIDGQNIRNSISEILELQGPAPAPKL